jgi:hypothetical protein
VGYAKESSTKIPKFTIDSFTIFTSLAKNWQPIIEVHFLYQNMKRAI